MPHALWLVVSLGITAAAPPTLQFEIDLTVEPLVARTVVVVPLQGDDPMPPATHRRLVGALQQALGDSVIPADRIEAAAKSIDPDKLHTVTGMAALAKSLGAARLLVFEPSRTGVAVQVFNSEGLALRTIELNGVKRFSSVKDARRVAKLFKDQAEQALSDPPAPAPPPEPDPLPEPAPRVTSAPEGIDPSMDIALEEGRDQNRRTNAPGRPNDRAYPVARFSVGASAGLRQLSASGSDSSALRPVEGGALPSFTVAGILQPLQLSPDLADAGWSGFLLEGRFRRALAHARLSSNEGQRCSVVDQDWMARAGWQSRPDNGSLPRLGGGAGFGSEEVRYGCELPTVNSRYRYAEVHARATQPLGSDRFTFELVLAPRYVFRGPGVDSTGFSWAAEGWLTAELNSWSFARAGARVHQTRVERADSLAVVDTRQFFAFEVGVQIP